MLYFIVFDNVVMVLWLIGVKKVEVYKCVCMLFDMVGFD